MLQGVWKQHLRPRAVVGYGLKIFLPSPPNYITRSPGYETWVVIQSLCHGTPKTSLCASSTGKLLVIIPCCSLSILHHCFWWFEKMSWLIKGKRHCQNTQQSSICITTNFLTFPQGQRNSKRDTRWAPPLVDQFSHHLYPSIGDSACRITKIAPFISL